MTTDPEIGGPSAEDRQLVYAQMRLNDAQCRNIETMVRMSGTRDVGAGALNSVWSLHNSSKNGQARATESHTCELVFAYELEMDHDVLGYYTQVPCRRVRRTTQYGRTHVSTANLDFLVFRRDGIELVECKTSEWLDRESQKQGALWSYESGIWRYPPYAEWALQYGLDFSVWAPPNPVGTYLQNLEACYAVSCETAPESELRAIRAVLTTIAKRPASLEELMEEVRGFSERVAMQMLADGVAFGPWTSTSIGQADRFRLYADREQARHADVALLATIASDQAQPGIQDPILLASTTDLNKGRERLARLARIEAGELPPTRRMQKLAAAVQRAVARGDDPLCACLTRYANSGNRDSRLLPEQEQAIETVIARDWNAGKARRPIDLVRAFEGECERLGVEASGRWRLDARRRAESPLRHALSTGGFRAYHAIRPSTDPRHRSQRPLGYGQVLHIDSSDLDVRHARDLLKFFPAAKAKFYIGIDGATEYTMAHSLIFGSARTDGLALLLREFVRRHGFLPRIIHVDRGSENTSSWLVEFCEGRITLRYSPTAGSAWNGLAENVIKQVNDQVAHQLVGSTAPDQKGRKVDGRFKSYRNAKLGFETVLKHFIDFVYQDLPNAPNAHDLTPAERKADVLPRFGIMGTPCEWNDEFLIRTSIKVDQKGKACPRRGIRTVDGYFTSDELMKELRMHKPDQVRSDCCYPEVLYVRIAGRWLKAFHNRVQSLALLSDVERLFEMLWAPFARSSGRKRRETNSRVRYSRIKLAEVARPANEHLAPTIDALESAPSLPTDVKEPREVWDELAPFEEVELG